MSEEKVPFLHEMQKLDQKTNEELLKYFKGERTGFVQVGPEKWMLTSGCENSLGDFTSFEPRPDDVWISSFPRSGNTVTQEIVWLLLNDMDFEAAATRYLAERFISFDQSATVHPEYIKDLLEKNKHSELYQDLISKYSCQVFKVLSKTTERRFIKTHLPFTLLPKNILDAGCKIFYLARNPKNVAVSYYHLQRTMRSFGYIGDFERFWKYFQNNLILYGPYWEHIKLGYKNRNNKNLCFLFYEDLIKDFKGNIDKISDFLEVKYSEEKIKNLLDHINIKKFKKNDSVNYDILKEMKIRKEGEEPFIRNGVNGGWQEYFSEDLNTEANKWIEENLKLTDLRFPE